MGLLHGNDVLGQQGGGYDTGNLMVPVSQPHATPSPPCPYASILMLAAPASSIHSISKLGICGRLRGLNPCFLEICLLR